MGKADQLSAVHPLLPKALAASVSFVVLLYFFPILIPVAIGLLVLAVVLFRNKPCDPNDVSDVTAAILLLFLNVPLQLQK